MRTVITRGFLFAALGAAVVAALPATDARACGGCFIPVAQTRSTQVSSHRMVMSIGKTSTTLWDQIEYVGDPSDFAWVLPIHGVVEVGVSSDLFFTSLENATNVLLHSPEVYCQPSSFSVGAGGTYGSCTGSAKATTGASGSGGHNVSEDEEVTVLQQSVVGPYETVQLSSTDPMALRAWLTAHGYSVPPEIDPTLDAYIAEGFDFLAIRLVPGAGIRAMQPIRVTTPGASLDLPLRMVAAGTGAFTPITLWVIGEGRYTTANMPEFEIPASQLTWDFNAKRSNYAERRAEGVKANGGATWLVESATGQSSSFFTGVVTAATADPTSSGYGGDPATEAQADMDAAIGDLDPGNIVVTRLFATLPKAALATDLILGASRNQAKLPRDLYLTEYVGDPCMGSGTPQPDCYGADGGSGSSYTPQASGCACSFGDDQSPLAALGLASGALGLLGIAWRRRVTRRGASRSSRG